MKVISDLHIHSKFSRAVSQNMTLPVIAEWAKKKGIGLITTGDFTHPIWFREIKSSLEEAGEGIYKLKKDLSLSTNDKWRDRTVYFLLSTEISSIYSQGGRTRRIHILIFAPNINTVEKINKELLIHGANLFSDGRPIIGLSAKNLAEIALTVDRRCLVIPAHAWTPWFSLYGSMSGFDSIEECFGDLSKNIYAVETGLSSDPAMNWRIEELTDRSIVSFSDAHSPQKLGREATVFETGSKNLDISYELIRQAIIGVESENYPSKARISHTIEFYPEEGKYHFSGHRNCNVVYSPGEERKLGRTCHVCGKPLTIGVMSRVSELGKKDIEVETEKDEFGVRWIKIDTRAGGSSRRKPYVTLVPLSEIIAESLGIGVSSKGVSEVYENLVQEFGSEYKILLQTKLDDLKKFTNGRIIEGIKKVRGGDISIEPGYDGVFGKVRIWQSSSKASKIEKQQSIDQGALF
jgi:DNA helicase-2/ATP-dependent DNA helicase PcrA